MTRNRSGLARTSLAVAVACALVPAGLATASPGHVAARKPVCNLVKPTAQNTQAWGPTAARTDPSKMDPSLQIISADVATKGSMLTWVIRVKKLSDGFNAATPTGRMYGFDFVANGVTVHMRAYQSQLGSEGDPTLPHSKATFDTQHNQVRESVPFGDIANQYGATLRNAQTTLTDLYVTATQSAYTPHETYTPYGSVENVGPVPSKYLAGTPSCLKVGS